MLKTESEEEAMTQHGIKIREASASRRAVSSLWKWIDTGRMLLPVMVLSY
jgi:hypothetical protein